MKPRFFTTLATLSVVALLSPVFAPIEAKKLCTLEEFYRLYYVPSTPSEKSHQRNLFWLQVALKMPFAEPMQALVVPKTKAEHERYKVLMRMHVRYLMTKSSVLTAARFDKHRPVFHDQPYKKWILESLDVAEYHYEVGLRYWDEVLKLQKELRSLRPKVFVPLDFLNDLEVRLVEGDLDYGRVIRRQLRKLEVKRDFYKKL